MVDQLIKILDTQYKINPITEWKKLFNKLTTFNEKDEVDWPEYIGEVRYIQTEFINEGEEILENFRVTALSKCSWLSEQMKLNVKSITRTNKDDKVLIMENVEEGPKTKMKKFFWILEMILIS